MILIYDFWTVSCGTRRTFKKVFVSRLSWKCSSRANKPQAPAVVTWQPADGISLLGHWPASTILPQLKLQVPAGVSLSFSPRHQREGGLGAAKVWEWLPVHVSTSFSFIATSGDIWQMWHKRKLICFIYFSQLFLVYQFDKATRQSHQIGGDIQILSLHFAINSLVEWHWRNSSFNMQAKRRRYTLFCFVFLFEMVLVRW